MNDPEWFTDYSLPISELLISHHVFAKPSIPDDQTGSSITGTMRYLTADPGSTAPTLPAAFSGRPHMPVRKLNPLDVARHKRLVGKLVWAVLMPIGTLGGFLLFPLLGIINAIAWLVSWLMLPGQLGEMFSGKWFQASCPNCAKLLNFRAEAFNCPFCTHRLMKYSADVYDIA